ncbi:MAG: hypothetical protein WAM85_19025 [Terracidiphilus sp.]
MISVRSAIYAVMWSALLSSSAAIAQPPGYMNKIGPVPPAVVAARSVFVSNAGSDSGLFPEPFSGDPSRSYTEFYSLLSASGAFQIVSDPSAADLVLELQLTAPAGPAHGSKQLGASDPVPMFRLVVYDRKTHYILWTETQSIEVAMLQKTHDRNFDEALDSILNAFLKVAGKPAMPPLRGR